MLGFTKQEQGIVLFLVLSLLIGSAVSLLREKKNSSKEVTISEQQVYEFRKKAEEIETASVVAFKKSGESPEHPKQIDLNKADLRQLQSLPKIGPVLAQKIIEYRARHGKFKTIEELMEVKGIGKATMKKLKPFLVLE